MLFSPGSRPLLWAVDEMLQTEAGQGKIVAVVDAVDAGRFRNDNAVDAGDKHGGTGRHFVGAVDPPAH